MSLQTRLIALITDIGADIKALADSRGNLASLTTSEKSNLVGALNEVRTLALSLEGGGAAIDDEATTDATTWSSEKIAGEISVAIDALINGAPGALDTLKELADALTDQDDAVSGLVTAVGNRVRFDAAQSLSGGEQAQACANIGVGNPETDLAAAYASAKA